MHDTTTLRATRTIETILIVINLGTGIFTFKNDPYAIAVAVTYLLITVALAIHVAIVHKVITIIESDGRDDDDMTRVVALAKHHDVVAVILDATIMVNTGAILVRALHERDYVSAAIMTLMMLWLLAAINRNNRSGRDQIKRVNYPAVNGRACYITHLAGC